MILSLLKPLPSCLLIWSACGVAAADFYVSPDGNDSHPGTRAQPFATFERARDAVRRLKSTGGLPPGGISVEFRGGFYQRKQPLELTAADSGADGAPIVYRARAGETVRISGGARVTGWRRVTNPEVLRRLEKNARGQVWQADLRALGLTDFGEVSASGKRMELFFQDKPMNVARWPNQGFVKITDVLGPTAVDVRGTKGCREGIFAYAGDRPKRWSGDRDIWLDGYWFWDWAEQRQAVASIDAERRIIRLKPPDHGYGYRKGQWFYAFNLLSELDQPGEWYLDRQAARLYFWPPGPLTEGVVSVAPGLIEMRDVSHVTLQGFILEACRGTAVSVSGGNRVRIVGCTIRNTGAGAVRMTGNSSGVAGCDIYGAGGGGISLEGGDRRTLSAGKLYAEDNYIHHYSRWDRVYQPAISLGGVGNRASHNRITQAPHMALGFSGNDHLIEFNEIDHVCYESNDAGAIYAGRDWTMRGTVIRYNYFHHISGFEGRGCVGVYLDDQFSGTKIFGNIFYKVTRAAMIGGGRDCAIENNIFVDCVPAVHVDGRGLGWAAGGFDGMKAGLMAMPYQEPPWNKRYPALVNILNEDPMAPKGNRIARNIQVGGRWGDFEPRAKPMVHFENNLLGQDPGFLDPAHEDFQLQAESPAFRIGFQRIPAEEIGLLRDAERASWPASDAASARAGRRR